jgi:hypothetical protein
MQLITQAEYARRRGVSRAAVTQAVKAGRIMLIDGRIDPDVADIQWAKNTPNSRTGGPATGAVPPTRNPLRGSEVEAPPAGAGDPTLLDARTRREQALAELAELELAEKRGELVPVEDIRKALVPKILGVRDALDTLADRLAPLLAAEADPAKVYAMLKQEHRQILAQLSSESRAPAGVQ